MNPALGKLFQHAREREKSMHKVFISYHHANDQWYKNRLIEFGESFSLFIDRSVDTGDIPETWNDQQIREKI